MGWGSVAWREEETEIRKGERLRSKRETSLKKNREENGICGKVQRRKIIEDMKEYSGRRKRN